MASTNAGLIRELVARGVLRTPAIVAAFRKVDRIDFIPDATASDAYLDIPLAIGYGQTISQPYTVAFMLELLRPRPGEHCLDIGAGSGWVTALLAEIVGRRGAVVGAERIMELAALAEMQLRHLNYPHVDIVHADASAGWPDRAPYDVIHVAAAAPRIPSALGDQLEVGGRLIIPVGPDREQELVLVKRQTIKHFSERRYPGFRFVPLVTTSGHR